MQMEQRVNIYRPWGCRLFLTVCVLSSGSSMRLIISTGKSIINTDRSGKNNITLITVNAADIDFDIADQILFFINKTDKQVRIYW